MKAILYFLFCFCINCTVFAQSQSGSLYYDDIQDLLESNTEIRDIIKKTFDVQKVGNARRISFHDNGQLSGCRVGSYHFTAELKDKKDSSTFDLTVKTKIIYLNNKGDITDLKHATHFKESVTGICVENQKDGPY